MMEKNIYIFLYICSLYEAMSVLAFLIRINLQSLVNLNSRFLVYNFGEN